MALDMAFPDLVDELMAVMPDLRGRLMANVDLSTITWFRIGGPAQLLFTPRDEADLAYFLRNLPSDIPVFPMGLGSNLLVRDGGVRGVVIRLGPGFGFVEVQDGHRLRVGTAVPDVKVARAAAEAGIDGLAFYRGIPGAIGGALRMNAGAHGTETKDVLVSARAVDRSGDIHDLTNADMGFAYRHCSVPETFIFTEATFAGRPGEPSQILKAMDEVAEYRAAHQPINQRTGGSTFRNPEGHSAWKLVDAAGLRGFRVGGAKVSEMHCNFLINDQDASGRDVETLGETIRAMVRANAGVELRWEIIRLGEPVAGAPSGEDLALSADEVAALKDQPMRTGTQ